MMNHPTDLLEAYALQILSPEMSEEVAAHIATCPTCAEELAYVTTTLALLSYAAPVQSPPPALEGRLFAKIASIRTAERQPMAAVPAITVPDQSPAAQQGTRKQVSVLPLPFRRPQRFMRYAIVAALVVSLVAAFFVTRQGGNVTPPSPLSLRQQAITELHAQGPTQTLLLGATDNGPRSATGAIAIDTTTGKGVVIVTHLPVLASDRTYEFWLVHDGGAGHEPLTLPNGTFRVDATGKGVYRFTSAGPVTTISNAGISQEHVGGVTTPDSPMLMLVVG